MIVNSSCCVVVLSQQQQALQHCNRVKNAPEGCSVIASKTCTIVENGRVVVKPILKEKKSLELDE